ncbi:MAG: hypothetical protein ACJ759_22810 [Thermoanaerobaculia bacterium]
MPGDLLATVEVRLAAQAGPIDLSLRAREPGEALRLARCELPRHVQDFLSRWAGSDSSLSLVHSIWLELDLDRELEDLPAPLVCAKLFPETDPRWLTGTLFPALQDKPLTAGQQRLIRRCHEAIPAPAYLLYAFSLLARGTDALRLEIFGLDPAGIVSYLERVAPESVPWVRDAAGLFEGVERIHLSLDLGEEVLPRIGIEGSFSRLPGREPRWGELFERLVSRGLCDPGKRDAALSWHGSETFWTAPTAWPVEAVGARGFCFRKLSHVKVVCRPGREPEAKAYLSFGYLPA